MKKYLLVLLIIIGEKASSQNVGIGTTAPQATLDVRGNFRLGGITRYKTFDSASGRIEWRNSNLYVPVTQPLIKHSAAADGLFYNNTAPVNGQLEYRNALGEPVFYTNFMNSHGYFKGNLGIGILNPQAKLHVQVGPSGYNNTYMPGATIEGNTNLYLSMLTNDYDETGLLFGKASDIASGGIVYNHVTNPNGLQFRTAGNITRLSITNGGNLALASPGGFRIDGMSNPGTGNASLSLGGYGELRVDAVGTSGGRFIVRENGNVGIGAPQAQFPLQFSSTLGDKIALWGNFGSHYGIGIASNLLYIHTDLPASDIAFGYGGWGFFTERMRVKGNGNVGISTSNPTEKLDVAGTVRASNYRYSSPKTLYYSVPAAAFQPILSTHDVRITWDAANYRTTNVAGELLAPINLPHGAVVTAFTVYYEDNSPGVELDVMLAARQHTSLGGVEVWASITSVAITGNTSTTVNTNLTINNQTKTFFISARSKQGNTLLPWPGFDLLLRSVVITYTVSEP